MKLIEKNNKKFLIKILIIKIKILLNKNPYFVVYLFYFKYFLFD